MFDSRKWKVVGLWQRGSRYYAQMRVDLGNEQTAPRRLPLEAQTMEKAKAEMERKRTDRHDGKLQQTGYRPQFVSFAREYLDCGEFAGKKEGTRKLEGWAIGRWVEHPGGIRVDKITPALIHSYREKRLKLGRAARTVNLDTIALRNVLKLARDRELIERLPETRQLREKPAPKRALLAKEQFTALIAAATVETTKNSALFRLYLRFLALTSAREKEALAVRWSDVDVAREIVPIGSGGVSKTTRRALWTFPRN